MLERILQQNKNLIDAYCQHPFNQQLYNGSLSRPCFEWFLHQDARYLLVFARVMRAISDRLQPEDEALANLFQRFHTETIQAEQDLNSTFLKTPSCTDFFRHHPPEPAPAITEYTTHLSNTVEAGTIIEAIVSCYPCFLLYAEVGKHYSDDSTENNYSSWTSLYASKEFLDSVNLISTALKQLTHSITCPLLEERLSSIFKQSVTFEIQFCDAALATAKQATAELTPVTDTSP